MRIYHRPMLLRLFVFIANCLGVVQPASAWNGLGHMEVAAIAWEAMTPAAKAEAGKLLTHNPLYNGWVDNVEAAERDRVAFIKSAQWADVIKRLSPYQPDGLTGSNGNRPPPGPDTSRNIGYRDFLQHKYWHFIDVPFSPDQTTLQPPDVPNAQSEIALLRAALTDTKTSADIRSYDLVWLVHLVGDVHQPLHATSRFTKEHADGDQGGNLVAVECGRGCSSVKNLHSFWDGVIGTNSSAAFASEAAARLRKADVAKAAIADEKIWIAESVALAQSVVYLEVPADTQGMPVRLSEDYKATARKVAEQQIALAGARLAHLLNQALR
jgi:hypothetical protein